MSPEASGERLDRFLAGASSLALSRAAAQRLIHAGCVSVNGAPTRPSRTLRAGDQITVRIPPPEPAQAVAQPIPLEVVFEDAAVIVVNKPPRLVVHPAPGHPDGTLVNALLHHCPDLQPIGGTLRPGIVHRLDQDTSGLLVVAKSAPALAHLGAQFKERSIQRRYLALVHGGGRLPERGTFSTLHGRHPGDRKRFSSKVQRGRRAVTHWEVLERLGPINLVRVRLETGRTHQIRVHFYDGGFPLCGDRVYGGRRADRRLAPPALGCLAKLPRQALHAATLGFEHPGSGDVVELECDLPEDLQACLRCLRARYGAGQP